VVGADHEISRPVRLEAVQKIRMKEGARGGAGIVVSAARVVIGLAGSRHEPVPVHDSNIIVLAGRGVPAQQVVVVGTDFADPVMMPDVVEIGLGEGYAE
jgi:hypothetical protein